jgi:UDP-N-acetyl-D-glucosamine dehydrogenase
MENVFRAANIALVNELKLMFSEMGISIHDVIDAAGTKPFGFMPFYPGPGLGGHCIPIDPFYLSWKAREFGMNSRFVELAGEINRSMPHYVVSRTSEALNSMEKAVKNSSVLCVGLAYKPDVDDTREAPAFQIMELLYDYGAKVDYYDPYLPQVPTTRQHGDWAGKQSVVWDKDTMASFDVVIIVTHHKVINYSLLADWATCIVDTRGVMRGRGSSDANVWFA